MAPEEAQQLKHNQQPQELIKIEREINGGGERKLALDGPRPFENLNANIQQGHLTVKQQSLLDIPYTELMKEFDVNFKEVCNKRQFQKGISRSLNQVRNLLKKEKPLKYLMKQEPKQEQTD